MPEIRLDGIKDCVKMFSTANERNLDLAYLSDFTVRWTLLKFLLLPHPQDFLFSELVFKDLDDDELNINIMQKIQL